MKPMTIIAASIAAITLAGCVGDNSTDATVNNQATQATINSCFSLTPAPSISGSQWWVSGTVNINNTCSSAQPLNGVVLTLANTSLTMNGSGFNMNNFTPYDSNNSLTFTNQNSAVVITINSNANLAANASAQFTFGGTPGLSKAPPANSFTVYLGSPTGEPTPTVSPTPTVIPTIVPTPLPLPTSNVITTGKIYYHFYLPVGSLNGDHMVLDGDNYTDLIISNIIAGSLLSRMVDETYPGIKYNQDYMIGSIWAQLLQENIDSAQYSHLSDDISPNGGAVMAGGQGGPYQLNNYAVDLIGQGAGRAMANYVAIQANIGYPLSSPLTAVTPPIFNNKYLGPVLTAYFHINDLIVIHLLGDGSLGYISTPVPDYIQCLEVSKTLPDSPFEVQMNYAYNAGFYAGLNQAAAAMCVSNPSKYNQVYNDYANAAGSSYNQYPYQVRFYLDEMFNRAPGIASLNNHIAFKTSQMRTIFAKVISKMAYTDKVGNYYPFTETQANTAFDAALTAYSVPVATTFDFSDANHRPSIYKILYGAFLNLENSTGFLFNTATKNQLILLPAPTPSPTATPVPSPTPSATPSPKPTVSPSPSPVPSPSPSVVPSPTPSPVPTVSPSPVPTQSPTPAPAKTGTVTITMPTVVSAYNGNLQVQLLNSKDSNAVVATYTVKQGASVTSGNLPISDTTHAYKVKLVSGIADPLNGVNYVESGTPTVAVKNAQNTAMTIPMKASTTTMRTVTLAISGLQGSDKATIGFTDANGKYSYQGYSGYGNGNAVFKIENNQSLTITVATAGSSYQSSSLSNSSTISKNQTIAMTFAAKVQPSPIPSPVPTVAPSPSPVPSPSPSVVPSPSPSPIASPTPAPSPSPSGVQCSSYQTWKSSTAYNGGEMVSYSGYVYKANWWTQNNNPATNNGGPGTGEEWLKIQACQ